MAVSSNLSILDVNNALDQLTLEEIRDLVFQMGVPLNVLKDIAAQYDGEERRQKFVETWLDRTPDASWEKLVAGLRKINKLSLAAQIESKHLRRALVPCKVSPPLPPTSPLSPSSPQAPAAEAFDFSEECERSLELMVAEAKSSIEHLQDEFNQIVSNTCSSLAKQECNNKSFLTQFREYLLGLSVSKRQVHVRLFSRNEDEILSARSIQTLFAIIRRSCTYSNYEIILHIVRKFCHELMERMLAYRDFLISFEMSTTVKVNDACTISARTGGDIIKDFHRMGIEINKPASVCTLYELRKCKESIEEKAFLESYATMMVYIKTPERGSVLMGLLVPEKICWRVGVVLMSPDFREKYVIREVDYYEMPLKDYLKDELQLAFRRGDVETVISLTAAGIPHYRSEGCSTLMMAVIEWGKSEVISQLLEAGNIDIQDKDGNSLLIIAARAGWAEVFSLLTNAGAALDLQNKEGDSAVILATMYHHLPVLKELVVTGADFNLQNQEKLTALMISSRSGRKDLTEILLLGESISLDIQNGNGWSALFFAADNGDAATTELLLRAGANPNLRAHNGLTALDYAVADNHVAVCRLLREYMQGGPDREIPDDEDASLESGEALSQDSVSSIASIY